MTEQRGHGFDIRLEIETLLAGNEALDVVGKGIRAYALRHS
jgi:hypothetical protein